MGKISSNTMRLFCQFIYSFSSSCKSYWKWEWGILIRSKDYLKVWSTWVHPLLFEYFSHSADVCFFTCHAWIRFVILIATRLPVIKVSIHNFFRLLCEIVQSAVKFHSSKISGFCTLIPGNKYIKPGLIEPEEVCKV